MNGVKVHDVKDAQNRQKESRKKKEKGRKEEGEESEQANGACTVACLSTISPPPQKGSFLVERTSNQ